MIHVVEMSKYDVIFWALYSKSFMKIVHLEISLMQESVLSCDLLRTFLLDVFVIAKVALDN